jgi:hypothetical protein
MVERVPCIHLDDTARSMKRLADSICLVKLIVLHNDPADDFHMDEHQVVQVGHQFKDGVTFMVLSMPHLLNKMARENNCKFVTQGHFDGALKLIQLVQQGFYIARLRNEQHGYALQSSLHQHCQSESKTFLKWSSSLEWQCYLCRFVCNV